jgi:IS1 transposase
VASAEEHPISDERRTLIEHSLGEGMSRRGICRAVGVSLTWLLRLMVEGVAACPEHLHVQLLVSPTDVVIRQRAAEADERWSVVRQKAHKRWLGSAMAARTRQVIACHVGARSRERAKQVWAKMPVVSREPATFPTDQDDA